MRIPKYVESCIFNTKAAHYLTALTGLFTRLPIPKLLRKWVLTRFANTFGVALNEVELPLDRYTTIDAFFTRGLRPTCRPIADNAVVCPVDGVLLAHGPIQSGQLVQAKGVLYACDTLINDTFTDQSGYFLTYYLSPKDCHRIFSPVSGTISRSIWVPGALYPVREPYISDFSGLYTRNERIVTTIDTAYGRVWVAKVGALNVGNMSVPFDPDFHPQKTGVTEKDYTPGIPINTAQWLGTFHLGSTVVLVFSSNSFIPDSALQAGRYQQYGQRIGTHL